MQPIELFFISLALYLAIGIAFGFFFVFSGAGKIDKVTQQHRSPLGSSSFQAPPCSGRS